MAYINMSKALLEQKNTYKILQKKYKSIWNKCDFLKPKNNNYCLIVNARRIKTNSVLKTKINQLLKKKDY